MAHAAFTGEHSARLGEIVPRLGLPADAVTARVRDVLLGLVAGADLVLWNYTMASLVFAGALAGHLPFATMLVLAGAALAMMIATLKSSYAQHVMVVDEQAVAVLATIAALMNARFAEFASPGAAAATIFVIMGCVTVGVGACLHLSVRLNASTLLQLVPFPVVCGFLGGLGWLLLGAGVSMLTGHHTDIASLSALFSMAALVHWVPALAGGVVIFAALRRSHHFLVLPGLLLAFVGIFYAIVWGSGASVAELRGTWLFEGATSAGQGRAALDFAHVDFGFIASVAPQIATIIGLSVLGASINLSGLEVAARRTLPLDRELRSLGSANIASGLVMGLPAVTEIVASVTYRKVGARGRLFMFVVAICCAAGAFGGAHLIAYLPKAVMAALVFFAAMQFLGDWMIAACRKLSCPEVAVVWSIFGTTAVLGFMPAIALGLALASLLFVVRYSRIDIVASSFLLNQRGSSVDRPVSEMRVIAELGTGVRAFNLRGFLFFGTASAFFEQLKRECDGARFSHLIFNFQRVTGIDSTVVQTFERICVFLESRGISAIYCGMAPAMLRTFERSRGDDVAVRCDNLDAALKLVEEEIVAKHGVPGHVRSIRGILAEALGDAEKGDRLAAAMVPVSLAAGEYLFRQGDEDTAIYVIENGAIEVRLEPIGAPPTLLREFRGGTVIGEMASYSGCRTRSASAVAVEGTVVYRLALSTIAALGAEAAACQAILHEFTARVLVSRLAFMSKRLALDV